MMNYPRSAGLTSGALLLAMFAGLGTRSLVSLPLSKAGRADAARMSLKSSEPYINKSLQGFGSIQYESSKKDPARRSRSNARNKKLGKSNFFSKEDQQRTQTISETTQDAPLSFKQMAHVPFLNEKAFPAARHRDARQVTSGVEGLSNSMADRRRGSVDVSGKVVSAKPTRSGKSSTSADVAQSRTRKSKSEFAKATSAQGTSTKSSSADGYTNPSSLVSQSTVRPPMMQYGFKNAAVGAVQKAGKTLSNPVRQLGQGVQKSITKTVQKTIHQAASTASKLKKRSLTNEQRTTATYTPDGIPMMNLLREDGLDTTEEETLPESPVLTRASSKLFGKPSVVKAPVYHKEAIFSDPMYFDIQPTGHEHTYYFKGKVYCGDEVCDGAKLFLRVIAPGKKLHELRIPIAVDGSYAAELTVRGKRNDQADWLLYATGDQGVRKELVGRVILMDSKGYLYQNNIQLTPGAL